MNRPQPVLPPRSRATCGWAPLALLVAIELIVYFVTTYIVLLPVLWPELGMTRGARHSSYLAKAVGVFLLVTYQVLFAFLGWSCARAITTPPGDIPSWLRSDGKSDLHSYSNLLQAVERKSDGSPRFCRKTWAYKPDRAHYCSEVNRCVLQYQTFSVTLNSAIGFYNYKFYLLAIFYGFCTSAWTVGSCLPEVIAQWPPFSSLPSPQLEPQQQQQQQQQGRHMLHAASAHIARQVEAIRLSIADDEASQWVVDATILFTLVVATLMLVPCLLLLLMHAYLVVNGRTLYEWRQVQAGKRPRGASLFDYGVLNNVALTLGMYPILWIVPTRSGIEGNGIFYPEQERLQ